MVKFVKTVTSPSQVGEKEKSVSGESWMVTLPLVMSDSHPGTEVWAVTLKVPTGAKLKVGLAPSKTKFESASMTQSYCRFAVESGVIGGVVD